MADRARFPRIASRFGIACAWLLALGSVTARASDDFQVNTYGPSNHVVCCPKIAMAADGRFVVVWVSAGSPGTDQDAGSIQARLYDADGMPRSDQFQVNTLTHWWQEHPSVAMDAAGGFVIAWESWESAEDDDSGTSIQARRYSANGEPWGSEFQINTNVSGHQGSPSVAMRSDGREFVVAWETASPTAGDPDWSVQAQRFGTVYFPAPISYPAGDPIAVNSPAANAQFDPAVAMDSSGSFFVAWTNVDQPGMGGAAFTSVRARVFGPDDGPLGAEFPVRTGADWDGEAAVSANDASVVVAWARPGQALARRFAWSGVAAGDLLVAETTEAVRAPTIAIGPQSAFSIAWTKAPAGAASTIGARAYGADDHPIGPAFTLAAAGDGAVDGPALAASSSGQPLFAWGREDGDAIANRTWSIWARRDVPEPAAGMQLAAALLALVCARRRRCALEG